MRVRILFFVITTLILFNSSSPWEGAAAVAPEGELPANGFFVATNSFPRNTVVDITNIENGRSTRVIVANTINSPGLLAVVSREAAELIGMRPGSISRIRMISPSDPIAFQRFIEGLASDMPQFDSGNVIRTEEELLAEVYSDDTFSPFAAAPQNEPVPPPLPQSHFTGPSYIMEPEWGGSARLEIVNVPRFNEQPVEPFNGHIHPFTEEPVYIAEPEPIEEEPVYTQLEPAEEDPVYIAVIPEEPEELPPVETAEDFPCEETVIVQEDPQREERHVEFNIVRAEERIPESGIYGIDPNDIIPSVAGVTTSLTPTPPTATERIHPAIVDETRFSIPRINHLDHGQFYVQIATLPTAELVEDTVRRIDLNYNPVVFVGMDNLYRILIGPLNQGESAAILARFRSIGYRDAFVRRGA